MNGTNVLNLDCRPLLLGLQLMVLSESTHTLTRRTKCCWYMEPHRHPLLHLPQ